MKPQKAFWWLLFLTFGTGFMYGQDYPDALAIRGLFLIVMAIFVLHTLVNIITHNYTYREEAKWKDPQSPLKTKPSNKGTVVTAAAVAQAIGTHVTVLAPRKPSASSANPKACWECLAEVEDGVCTNNPQHLVVDE